MQLAQDREQDLEAAEERGREDSVATDADVEGAVAGFIEAVRRVPVGGEDGDGVAEGLEGEGGVEDEALGAADAEVRVEEDDASGAVRWVGHGVIVLTFSIYLKLGVVLKFVRSEGRKVGDVLVLCRFTIAKV